MCVHTGVHVQHIQWSLSEILINVLCNQPELNQMLRFCQAVVHLLMNSMGKPDKASCYFRGQQSYKLELHTLFQRQLFLISREIAIKKRWRRGGGVDSAGPESSEKENT